MKSRAFYPNKVVLSGGPGVGKTTLLSALAKLNYRTLPEAAASVLKDRFKEGGVASVSNVAKFQCCLFKRQLAFETGVCESEIVFLDRSLIDIITYSLLFNINVPKSIERLIKNNRYWYNVFILEPLSIYNKDDVRKESWQRAIEIHNLLKKTYKEYGFSLIEVPAVSVQDRVEFVIKRLDVFNEKFSL